MLVMPVELGGDMFRFQILCFELIRGFELGNGFSDASNTPKFVSIHMSCMRNGGSQFLVGGRMFQRFVDLSRILEEMNQVVMRWEVICFELKRSLIEAFGAGGTALTTIRWIRRFRHSTLNPKLCLFRKSCECIIDGLPIDREFLLVQCSALCSHLCFSNDDITAFTLT